MCVLYHKFIIFAIKKAISKLIINKMQTHSKYEQVCILLCHVFQFIYFIFNSGCDFFLNTVLKTLKLLLGKRVGAETFFVLEHKGRSESGVCDTDKFFCSLLKSLALKLSDAILGNNIIYIISRSGNGTALGDNRNDS